MSWLVRWQGTEAGASNGATQPHCEREGQADRDQAEQHSLPAKWGNPEVQAMIKTQSSSPFRKTAFTPQEFRDSHWEGRSRP